MSWINPKVIIGTKATGDYYFGREGKEAEIWDQLLRGCYVLLAAPRRVGKSSIMENMMAYSPEGIECVYKNIEGLKTEQDFYKTLYTLIVHCLSRFARTNTRVGSFLKGLNIKSITLEGIEFAERKVPDYLTELNDMLPKLRDNDVHVVLLLDELPELLHTLYKAGNGDKALSIISNIRVWEQDQRLKNHFSMVLAGSVGIDHVVKRISGRLADINQLARVPVDSLTDQEVDEYIRWAVTRATVQYTDEQRGLLKAKMGGYGIPYFINLLLDELNRIARKSNNPILTNGQIDSAFDRIVKDNSHFVDWKKRLFDYFSTEADFMNEVLIYIAHKQEITPRQLYDLAVKHQQTRDYIEIVDGLERDGYITEHAGNYVFLSPFLQAYWKRNNPVYDGN
ncbi:hypothetical protein ACAW74_19070 [Fibrella sp. WM1]|uniref:hypothetical protein n=1 Tax=Fibrella musci TaxID=3242485 RepID=UPI0035200528